MRKIVDEAAGEILKVLTRPRIGSVPIVEPIESKKVSPVDGGDSKGLRFGFDSAHRQVRLGGEMCRAEKIVMVEATMSKVPTDFKLKPREMEIVEPEISSTAQVQCLPKNFVSIRMTGFDISPERARSALDRFIRPRAKKRIIPSAKPDWVKKLGTFKNMRPIQDVDRICDHPIIAEPVPWTRLDRKMIIACWELLRGQAVEELGGDPGRDLEMLGVYVDIRPGLYRGSGYDPATRRLALYPQYPSSDKPRDESAIPCAIIVGAIRGTARLLQATMHTFPDSD